jgi:hypothetical protein
MFAEAPKAYRVESDLMVHSVENRVELKVEIYHRNIKGTNL